MDDYQGYSENIQSVTQRLRGELEIERLQDEMRIFKRGMSFENFAHLIPDVVAEFAPGYPSAPVGRQNIYEFLRLDAARLPNMNRRLMFHAFMMITTERYRSAWAGVKAVVKLGNALADFFGPASFSSQDEVATDNSRLRIFKITPWNTQSETTQWSPDRSQWLIIAPVRAQRFQLAFMFEAPDSLVKAPTVSTSTADSWNLNPMRGYAIARGNNRSQVLVLKQIDGSSVTCAALFYERDVIIKHQDEETICALDAIIGPLEKADKMLKSPLGAAIPAHQRDAIALRNIDLDYWTAGTAAIAGIQENSELAAVIGRKFD